MSTLNANRQEERVTPGPIVKLHAWKSEHLPKYSKFPDSFNQPLLFSSPQYITDEDFDARCPEKIRILSSLHWTPVLVAREAAKFLVTSRNTKVLDIGSGVGKFCIAAAAYSNGLFIGVEQRKGLCNIAKGISQQYDLPHVKFLHTNITQVNFKDYDALYFYNSFYENIEQSGAIDYTIDLDPGLYHSYNKYMIEQLAAMPGGTRLVTYHGDHNIPVSYELLYTDLFGALKFWQKAK